MFSFIPLALVISLILNAPALWEAFNNPQADLFGTLTRLFLVAVLVTVVLSIANRVMGHYLAHPKIDVVPSLRLERQICHRGITPHIRMDLHWKTHPFHMRSLCG